MPEAVYQRRRRVATTLALVAVSGLLICLELIFSDPIPVQGGAEVATVPQQCIGGSRSDLERQLGMRLVVRMTDRATPALRRQARRGEIGGVVLFPPAGVALESLAAEVAKLQRAASRGNRAPLVVAIDQEGGTVKRLVDLPPDRSPRELSRAGADAARAEGLATGTALAELGINVDLAPVLDVPASGDSFIIARSFGTTPGAVAEIGIPFAKGLADAGVVATAKHFPGLGHAPVNTDLSPAKIAVPRAELRADLEPFKRAAEAGIGMVMLANASYPALGGDRPAFAAERIVDRLLRERLGFAGVTITDDLGAGAVRSAFEPEEAAVAAAQAGVDLLLFALVDDPQVLDGLVAAARRGELGAADREESCARVLELREGLQAPRQGESAREPG